MFERFSREARLAVVGAQEVARTAGAHTIDTRHVLAALAEQDGPASRGLRSVGVDIEALAVALRIELSSGGLDAEALASLGIDLDAVRERADEVFGPGALDRAGQSPGHIPFTSDAKRPYNSRCERPSASAAKTSTAAACSSACCEPAARPATR